MYKSVIWDPQGKYRKIAPLHLLLQRMLCKTRMPGQFLALMSRIANREYFNIAWGSDQI